MSTKNHIAIVASRFNSEITTLLLAGARERLLQQNIPFTEEDLFMVPGAVEIPVVAATLARQGKYAAILCLGAVIRGDTSHYDYVCWQVSYGCQKVAIEYQLPVIFGVLTTDNTEQALARCGGAHGHKGQECADAAIEMAALLHAIRER